MARSWRSFQASLQRRAGNGRFRDTALADFGLGVVVCKKCNGCNPYKAHYGGDPCEVWTKNRPTECSHCGAAFEC